MLKELIDFTSPAGNYRKIRETIAQLVKGRPTPRTDVTPVETEGEVVLENGDLVSYDALVLSPGSSWSGSFAGGNDPSQVRDAWAEDRKRVEAAQNIVLVGAGAVGLELAGEIKSEYPVRRLYFRHSSVSNYSLLL